MNVIRPLSIKRFFRSPATIVGELLCIAMLGGIGAALPQIGAADGAELARLRGHGRFLTALVDGLALDHVFTSPAFLVALTLATVSLIIVVVEQIKRFRLQWSLPLTVAHFRAAPFRREFARPASTGAFTRMRSRGRLGLAGSPLFHTGLLCVILAGGLRALFGVEAVVDLYEGEVLPATVEAWGAQRPGPLGKPFQLDAPLELLSVESSHYRSGDLMGLRLKLSLEGPGGPRVHELGVNQELRTRRGRLYMDAKHGPTALIEWETPGGPALRTAALLERKEAMAYGAYAHGPGSLVARLRAPVAADGSRAEVLEVRILQGPATVAETTLKPGGTLSIPGGGLLKLHGLPTWARLHGNHDPALWLAYLGFFLALLGAALTYSLIRVDELVSVLPEGENERVIVALKPYRFIPLFQERFERLLREHGGGA